MNCYFISILSILQINIFASFSQNRPFPQHVQYYDGVILPNNVTPDEMAKSVSTFYDDWKGKYLKNISETNQCYICSKDATPNECISEGQGYGMVIVALMAGQDVSAHQTYDGLYKFYKEHPSLYYKEKPKEKKTKINPYLMAWAQNKDLSDKFKDAATDGDMDIAYSLLLADAQWGSSGINYKNEAKQMISAIAADEINPVTFSILKGNAIEDSTSTDYYDMRTSDFMPANLKTFAKFSGNDIWLKVIDKSYKLFESFINEYSSKTGLLTDYILHINNHPSLPPSNYNNETHTNTYNYNACRIPWRLAMDYILNGDPRSKKLANTLNEFIIQSTHGVPLNISPGYELDGRALATQDESSKFAAMSYLTPFAVSAMVDSQNQKWLNDLWIFMLKYPIKKRKQFNYYDNTIKLLNMIIISGNYWTP